MPAKFARLDYVKTLDDVPVQFNVVKQNVENNLIWYIDKFNPLVITECAIAGEVGVKVLLPLTKNESITDMARTRKIISRTIENLKTNEVEIILPPDNVMVERKNGISVADGTNLFPFFICQAIQKWAMAARRDLRRCEAVIINAQYRVTESVLDHICNNLNFVTVMNLDGDRTLVSDKADRIFDETGLNVVVRGKNKAVLKTADIIINTASSDFDTAYKRGAVVFDLSGDIERRKTLITRRPDVSVIDGLILNYKNTSIPLTFFELALYLKNRHFRYIVSKHYDTESGEMVQRDIKKMGLSVASFTRLGQVVKPLPTTRNNF